MWHTETNLQNMWIVIEVLLNSWDQGVSIGILCTTAVSCLLIRHAIR
jgi:hypothetical protein